jgi:CheY-like chemotaxis protein
MDGVEAARLVREKDRSVPIIALTANAVTGVREEFLKAGMNDMIAKPIDAADLNLKLAKWLKPERIVRFETASPRRQGEGDAGGKGGAEAAGPKTAEGSFREPVLDRQEGLGRCGGDGALYEKLCDSFVSDHGEDCERIKAAALAGNISEARRLAHTLKSTAALIGARAVRRVAGNLEAAFSGAGERIEGGLSGSVSSLLEEPGTAMKDLLDELGPREPCGPGDSADDGIPALSPDALVERLEPLLKSGNAASLELIPDIRKTFTLDMEAALLVKQIEDFDFTAACGTLAKLRRT